MKTRTTVLLILAAVLILGGATLAICAWMAVDCDLSALNTTTFVHHTHTVEDAFDAIRIHSTATDIRLVPIEGDSGAVACAESESLTYTVEVRDNTLHITENDDRQWYEYIGISWTERELIVQLPQNTYRSLYVEGASGNLHIPETLHFEDITAQTASGDINIAATVSGTLSVKTASGDIAVSGDSIGTFKASSASGDISITAPLVHTLQAESVSGDVELSRLTCDKLSVSTTSGEIDCNTVTAAATLNIKSVSGDVELERCDAAELTLKTTSGNIHGTLLSPKQFTTDTLSGNVRVAPDAGDGTCTVKTTSGNITITVEE